MYAKCTQVLIFVNSSFKKGVKTGSQIHSSFKNLIKQKYGVEVEVSATGSAIISVPEWEYIMGMY